MSGETMTDRKVAEAISDLDVARRSAKVIRAYRDVTDAYPFPGAMDVLALDDALTAAQAQLADAREVLVAARDAIRIDGHANDPRTQISRVLHSIDAALSRTGPGGGS